MTNQTIKRNIKYRVCNAKNRKCEYIYIYIYIYVCVCVLRLLYRVF